MGVVSSIPALRRQNLREQGAWGVGRGPWTVDRDNWLPASRSQLPGPSFPRVPRVSGQTATAGGPKTATERHGPRRGSRVLVPCFSQILVSIFQRALTVLYKRVMSHIMGVPFARMFHVKHHKIAQQKSQGPL